MLLARKFYPFPSHFSLRRSYFAATSLILQLNLVHSRNDVRNSITMDMGNMSGMDHGTMTSAITATGTAAAAMSTSTGKAMDMDMAMGGCKISVSSLLNNETRNLQQY